MDNKVFQFKVVLMTITELKEHFVNCANEISAKYIAQNIFPKMRVIDIIKIY
jgi:hypothetical protein